MNWLANGLITRPISERGRPQIGARGPIRLAAGRAGSHRGAPTTTSNASFICILDARTGGLLGLLKLLRLGLVVLGEIAQNLSRPISVPIGGALQQAGGRAKLAI